MKEISIILEDDLYNGIVDYLKRNGISNPQKEDVQIYIGQFLKDENADTGEWTILNY